MRRHRLFFSNDSIIIKRHMAPRSNQHTQKKGFEYTGPVRNFRVHKTCTARPAQPADPSLVPAKTVRHGRASLIRRHVENVYPTQRLAPRLAHASSCAVSSSTPARARNSAGAAIVARGDRRIVNGKWRFIQKSTGGEMVSLMMLS